MSQNKTKKQNRKGITNDEINIFEKNKDNENDSSDDSDDSSNDINVGNTNKNMLENKDKKRKKKWKTNAYQITFKDGTISTQETAMSRGGVCWKE